MRVSVIITTFNRGNIINMCMDSLINQNFPKEDYEILIMNNNSSDNTEEVIDDYIEKYPGVNIRYFFVPRSGQVYARQVGILAARGSILCFSDDDGILSPDWIKEIVKVFNMNEEVAGVAGKIVIRWDEKPPDWIYEYEKYLGKLDYGDAVKFEKGLYMNAGNLSIKKDILIEVGGFNPEMIGQLLIGDGETGLWVRLKQNDYLIGWAPNAVMEHYQIAKKNATVGDIKRRYKNNGICIPYNIFAIRKEGITALIKNLMYCVKQTFSWTYKIVVLHYRGTEAKKRFAIFRRAFYYAQIEYTLNILLNKKFRRAITSEDWVVRKPYEYIAA